MKKKTFNILLIEDDPTHQQLLEDTLDNCRWFRYTLKIYSNLGFLDDKLENDNFDLALLDLCLPDSEYYETLEKVQTYFSQVPIIILTALDDPSYLMNLIQYGAIDYIPKHKLSSDILERAIYFGIDRWKKEQAVRLRQKELNTFFELVDISLIQCDAEGIIRDVNPAFQKFLGYNKQEIIGKDIRFITQSEDIQKSMTLIRQLVNGEMERFTIEKRYITKNKQAVWGEVKVRAKRDLFTGEVTLIAEVLDITERKSYEDKLLETNKKLEASIEEVRTANRAKSVFLSTISHDLRTPLNSILGLSELLIEQNEQEKTVKFASIINKSGKVLLELIQDVLEITEIESNINLLKIRAIDVREILDESLSLFKDKYQGLNIDLLMEIDSFPNGLLWGDPTRIQQLLNNLIGNAFKHTKEGYIKIKLELAADGDFYFITVEDTGCGIPKEEITNIYQPFYRSEISLNQKIQGSGLGLSICSKLVKIMKGEIITTSEVNKGSSFTLKLPYERAEDESKKESLDKDLSMEVKKVFKQLNILVIDDDMDSLSYIEALLSKYSPRSLKLCDSSLDAVNLLKDQSFDLVLLDIKMPKMDGFEVLKIIRDLDRSIKHRTLAIALTAHLFNKAKEKALDAGFDAFFSKPFVTMDFLKKVYQLNK